MEDSIFQHMSQTRFSFIKVSQEKKKKLEQTLVEIYHTIKNRFKSFETFQKVLLESSTFDSHDLRDEQAPEEFTKRYVVEPLIRFLGFEIVAETVLASPEGRREPDYKIRPEKQKEPMFYVEAEPINFDLYSKGHGKSQVDNWLLSRVSETDYGMATDGLKWIVFRFDTASAKSKVLDLKIDFRLFFLKILNPHSFTYANEIERAEEDFLKLDCEIISVFLNNYLEKIEKDKEEITKRFYNDYVKYVFGVDEKGNTTKGVCLLNKVLAPPNATKKEVNLFSVVFMNRLIFMKFLEEKKIIPKDFLKKFDENYKSSGAPSSFYETYLKPLFYEVFNKNKNDRISRVRSNPFYNDVPYLNGGLFREVVGSEKNYTVENEGVELILEYIEKYSFSSESGIDPDILGYIFEKTINFISGTGTDQQKMQGAYYTPDDVVGFIIEQTLIPIIFKKMIEGLRDSGWKDADLQGYESIDDLLNPQNVPKNPIHVRKMVEAIDMVKILDPACGSGHFLTAALSEILRIKESLLRTIGEDVHRYDLKRSIVSKNLFGVDIDQDAVEIARLRLWLSIIDEVADSKHIETLPNIDFNIISGNSLVGWLNEDLLTHPLISLLDDQEFKNTLDTLSISYKDKVEETRKLLGRMKLEDTVEAYRSLVETYSLESGEQAVKLREVLERIRNKLYEVINNSYLDFLHENSSLGKTDFEQISKDLAGRIPLHWKIDFQNVLSEGGFDVVVGNPPYIEDNNYDKTDLKIIGCQKKSKKTKNKLKQALVYHSNNCGNTHAYFIERSIKLLKTHGRFAFIVPISLVSTDRMGSIREFIHNNSSETKYYNFDDRPGKIFSGIEDCRSTILITERGEATKEVNTSKYHRWLSKERTELFTNLKTVVWNIKKSEEIVPKIGSEIEKRILGKLTHKSNGKIVGNFLKKDGTAIWYHNAPRYWIHAHTEEYTPKVEYYKGYKENKVTGEKTPYNLQEVSMSDQYKPLILDSDGSTIINGLLSSSLFYWWYVVWSDGRHLLAQHISSFPINLDSFQKTLKERLTSLVNELMEDYDKNSNVKINLRSGGYVIKIKEIIPSKSKKIIDQIDDVFAEYFEFNDKEKDFIRKFDMEFRIADR